MFAVNLTEKQQRNFDAKFTKGDCDDSCWEWHGARIPTGYGLFGIQVNGKQKMCYAHRIAYAVSVAPIPEGICACHSCDNPSCVNPRHVFLATVKGNMHDKISKGRARALKGEEHAFSKLTEKMVSEIRSCHRNGSESYRLLSLRFGVSLSTVAAAAKRRTWKHVP